MNRRWMRVVAAAASAILISTGGGAPAQAGGPAELIIGDLNGDGIGDQVMLTVNPPRGPGAATTRSDVRSGARAGAATVVGAAPRGAGSPAVSGNTGTARRTGPGRDGAPRRRPPAPPVSSASGYWCEAVVALGDPAGGHLPPAHHPYLQVADPADCPDLGAAANLDADAADELVAGWFIGRPAAAPGDLIVIDDFRVVNAVDAIYQPSFIGSADFNGDGHPDIYQWTDQGEGFRTFFSTGVENQLVPGPIQWCSGTPDYQLADLLGNGTLSVVLAYFEGCGDHFSGVVVILPDGRTVHLQGSVDGDDQWSYEVLDANGDGYLDVRTFSQTDDRVTTFVNHRDGTFVTTPQARTDQVTISGFRRTGIPVLANDEVTPSARLRVAVAPRYGIVQLTSARTVVYTPLSRDARSDRFVYEVIDEGRSSKAPVLIRLTG